MSDKIDKNVLWQRAEYDMRTTRTLSESTREAIASLPAESRIAFVRPMKFSGFEAADEQLAQSGSIPESDRVNAARLMLLLLRSDSNAPAWSSWMLDRMLESVVELPGGSVGDLLHALHEILGVYGPELRKPVAGFINDIVIASFSRHRESYESLDWKWLAREALQGQTPAQAYLALLALPTSELSARNVVAILRSLVTTPYWENAVASLSEYVQNEEGRMLLSKWLEEGIQASNTKDVKRMLEQV